MSSEETETVSTLVHKILLAQADLVDIEAAARLAARPAERAGAEGNEILAHNEP